MTLTHVFHRGKRLTILNDPAHLSPKTIAPISITHLPGVCAGSAHLLPPVTDRLPILSLTLMPTRPATNARPAPPPMPAPCHRNNAPVVPPLVVNVKQANNKCQACATTVTTTIQPFVIASVASSLVVNDKQADDERWACAAVARQCRRRVQMRDHRSIPMITRQSHSPDPLSPPPHHPPIPFATVRAPLAPASLPSVINQVNMWPLGWRLALLNSGLMPIRRLLSCLSPPHLRPPILLAAIRTLLPSASTPPVVIFV